MNKAQLVPDVIYSMAFNINLCMVGLRGFRTTRCSRIAGYTTDSFVGFYGENAYWRSWFSLADGDHECISIIRRSGQQEE